MTKFLTPGVLAGLLVLASSIAGAAGFPVAGAILADPTTAAHATMILTGVGGIVASVLAGVRVGAVPGVPVPAVTAGVFALVSAIANAAGFPLAGALVSDPATAASSTMVLTGVGAVLGGLLPGLRR